ncbi:MAG: asparagine--tRNA ligase [Vicingaceae bacterium]
MKHHTIKEILAMEAQGQQVSIKAWVRTFRNNQFISVYDGSTLLPLQVVIDQESAGDELIKQITTGASLSVEGELIPSKGSGQRSEVKAVNVEILGESNPEKYPLQPKKHSLEFLREIAHLRFRTNTFNAVFKLRHAVSFAIHEYFHKNGFNWIHSPIITGSDAEGAGEMFRVTSMDLNNLPKGDDGKLDSSADFFGKETNLTVSGQLEAELAAMGLGKVYTFGPTFRAENSNTSRHLAEFWMIEPEVAFADLNDNMDLAEDCLKYVIKFVLDNYKEELEFLKNRRLDHEKNLKQEDRSEMDLIEQLNFVLSQPFERITYTDAIEILRNSKPNKKKKFKYPIEGFGADLQSEHERYLVEKHFKKPVILTDYPKEIKAFYMRMNDDGKTVRAMDILFPGIGEIVGGSQREEREDALVKRMVEMEVDQDEMWWYLDTRKFGTVPHSGFGLGLERLLLFITGMSNVRDVIPFPRTPKNAEF